jgi:hypothetical protein
MGVTININGLSLVHKCSGGVSRATLPDVCKTPPNAAPVPYPNTSFSKTLAKGTTTVKVDGGNMAAVRGSEFSTSIGDEPGTLGGVKSGVNMKESTWLTFSFDVFLDGRSACRLTDKKLQNHCNTVDAAGISQANLTDPVLKLLCDIFCEAREKGKGKKGFHYSGEAKKLASSEKYASRLDDLATAGKKLVPEKSFLVAVEKGAIKGRKIYTLKAIESRLKRKAAKDAALKVGKGYVGKKVVGKVASKFVPVLGWASAAADGIDIISTGIDLYKAAMGAYDHVMIRPDVGQLGQLGPDGELTEIYDYKFDDPTTGYQDTVGDDQAKLYQNKTGKEPKIINQELCKCD